MTNDPSSASQETPTPVVERDPSRFPPLLRSGASFFFEILKVVVISLAIIVPIRYFLFQPFYVKGASMEPTFFDNEYLIINEIDYRFHAPARGDIVVIRFHRDPSQFFIKRIIGLPGEQVSFLNGKVMITNSDFPDGFTLDEDPYLSPAIQTIGGSSVTLDADEYFVLGDNRASSLDSRSTTLGPVKRSAIVGRAWFRVWPFNKMTHFRTPEYVP